MQLKHNRYCAQCFCALYLHTSPFPLSPRAVQETVTMASKLSRPINEGDGLEGVGGRIQSVFTQQRGTFQSPCFRNSLMKRKKKKKNPDNI